MQCPGSTLLPSSSFPAFPFHADATISPPISRRQSFRLDKAWHEAVVSLTVPSVRRQSDHRIIIKNKKKPAEVDAAAAHAGYRRPHVCLGTTDTHTSYDARYLSNRATLAVFRFPWEKLLMFNSNSRYLHNMAKFTRYLLTRE
ncbi:hypothetical protein EVAR_52127_1 [Eumeta japonica]|uniref:Uncharacterized protein n=1 Tax=Eumeta variegata TaxID=151549 RepID=A0A4C1XQM2_EUMVA|nr:hypothetical protein EVAR_52127_1 [Eumeta japonica]